MSLDRAHLTKDEREEIRRALIQRRSTLARRVRADPDSPVVRDAKWRLFVVTQLLDELDG